MKINKYLCKLIRRDCRYIIYNHLSDYLIRSFTYNDSKYNDWDVELAIVAIVKNEASYIKEWIEYHRLVGVQRFYIYNNESTDNLLEILKPYIDSGIVVYELIPGSAMQIPAYKKAINDYKLKAKYMAFIDADEFIVPKTQDTILGVIKEIEDEYKTTVNALALNWKMFGFNGYYNKPEGLVTENYTKCEYPNQHIKSIINPRLFYETKTTPHHFIPLLGRKTIDEKGCNIYGPFNDNPTYNKIQINHDWSKSYEEYLKKINRGLADSNNKYNVVEYDSDYLSKIYDDAILRFIPALKNNLA